MFGSENITLLVLIALCAVVIGLILRHFLILRLRRTILDKWLVQLLGAVVFVLPLIAAVSSLPLLLRSSLVDNLIIVLLTSLPFSLPEIKSFAWEAFLTLFAIVLGVGVGRTMMKVIIHALNNNRIDINLRVLIGRIFFIIVMIIDAFWVFTIWGLAIAFPVTIIGALTVTFTIAFQDILKDLVAGFYILMERPFHIGDSITIGNAAYAPLHTGVVENIELRATKLRITSGEQVTVPNALVFGGIVINNSFYNERRATISITLPIAEFVKEEMFTRITKTLEECDMVVDKPEPTVVVSSYTGQQVILIVRFWMKSEKFASISEVMYTLRTAFPPADLSFVESAGEFS
ncbi:MAG: mechanosensitive ion channel family protein [Chloroflexota bacterium]|nr:mechanosensitive ion channel family protein [Chloroflexota bacterium]